MNQDFKDLLQVFNENRVKYLIIGGYAVIKHTEPRFTKDLDLWVSTETENAAKVYASLADYGAPLFDLQPNDFEDEGFFYTIGVPPNRIDIVFEIKGVDEELAWERRVDGHLGDLPVVFIGRNELIQNKETVGRLQDLADAEKLRETGNEKKCQN